MPASAGGGRVAGLAGVVRSQPVVVAAGPPLERLLRRLVILLLVTYVLVQPALLASVLSGFILLVVLVLILGWVLSKVGLLALFFFVSGRSRRAPDEPDSMLVFRWDGRGSLTDVRLRGNQVGVQLGDHVVVDGWTWRGALYPTRVVNHTTGVVLRRPGVARVWIGAMTAAFLLLGILGAVVAR